MKLQVILEPSDEGGYTASIPASPGCISEGDNIDGALANIQEAIKHSAYSEQAIALIFCKLAITIKKMIEYIYRVLLNR